MDFSQVSEYLVAALKPTLLAAATYVGATIAGWFRRKTKVDVERQVAEILARAVAYAEESAHNFLKATGKKLEASKKLQTAEAFARREFARLGIDPSKLGEHLRELIEAAVNRRRGGASVAA